MNKNGVFLFSSESVTRAIRQNCRPDLRCHSRCIMRDDPMGRGGGDLGHHWSGLAGEITTDCYVDIPRIARETVKEIGYTRAKYGFDGDTCSVLTSIDEQSPDIALGVNESWEIKHGEGREDIYNTTGAGDQGIIFGFACNETPELMPMPIDFAHKLARRLAVVRKENILPYLRPDGKSQVTVEYRDGKPQRVATVVLAAQHSEDISLSRLREI